MPSEATTTNKCTVSKKIEQDIFMKPRAATLSGVQKEVTANGGNTNVHNPTDAVPKTSKLIEATEPIEASTASSREITQMRQTDYINSTPREEANT